MKPEYKHFDKDRGQIALYLRSEKTNAKWWARIKINGDPHFRTKSTYTSDFNNALVVATERYESLADKFRRTGSTKLQTFRAVVDLWLSHITKNKEDSTKIEEYRERLFNYPVRLWGDRQVDQLKHSDLEKFLDWRKANGKRKDKNGRKIVPKPATIKRDIVPLQRVLKFAYTEEFIPRPLSFDRISVTVNPTPCFLEDEWIQLMGHLDDWISSVKWGNKKHIRNHVYLKYYILILGLTGIRPGTEARAITWSSIKLETIGGTPTWVIYVPGGKTGKRPVVTDTFLLSHIPTFKAFRENELNDRNEKLDENEPIFCHEDGKPIKSFKSGFRTFLDAYGLTENALGDNRVPYSLRHTYATRMISFDIRLIDLAQNMGTSVKMLEQTYLHKNHQQYGKAIANRLSKGNISLPFVGQALPTSLPAGRISAGVPVVTLTPTIRLKPDSS